MSDEPVVLHDQRKRKTKSDKKQSEQDALSGEQIASFIRSEIGCEFRYNSILQRIEYRKALEQSWYQWTDAQDSLLMNVRSAGAHKDLRNLALLQRAVSYEAYKTTVNPVREYLARCPPDWTTWVLNNGLLNSNGLPASPGDIIASHIETDMDKQAVAAIFDAWLVGCVMHGYNPEANEWAGATICPVLVGPQGRDKSNFTKWIGTAAGVEYYDESVIDVDSKDSQIGLARTWIWAADEFSGTLKKRGAESVKNFLTRKTINLRLPYQRTAVTLPRLASFIASCNQEMPLQDTTGNRRYAVIKLERVRLADLKAALPLERLWGGAMHLWKSLHMTPALSFDARATVEAFNDLSTAVHPWTDQLLSKLEFHPDYKTTISEILTDVFCLGFDRHELRHKTLVWSILRSSAFNRYLIENKLHKENGKVFRVIKGCRVIR
jgi:hypothetical protein